MVDDFRTISRKCGKKLEKYRDFFRNNGISWSECRDSNSRPLEPHYRTIQKTL